MKTKPRLRDEIQMLEVVLKALKALNNQEAAKRVIDYARDYFE